MNFILFRKYRVVVLCAFGLKASGTKDLLGVPCSLGCRGRWFGQQTVTIRHNQPEQMGRCHIKQQSVQLFPRPGASGQE